MDCLNLDPSLDDIHMVIGSEVIKNLGEDVAGRMHTGRSRNDEVATDLRMALRDKILTILFHRKFFSFKNDYEKNQLFGWFEFTSGSSVKQLF